MKKTKQLFAGLLLILLGLGTLQAQECPSKRMEGTVCLPKGFPVEPSPNTYQLNLTEGHTQISHDVHDLHMLILWICVTVGIGVFGVMFYSIYHHRKSKGHVAAQFHENTTVEIIWTVIPALILISMAIPATKTMMEMDDVQDSDMTVKVTGWQWKWEYEYLGTDIRFFSNLDEASNNARQLNSGIDSRAIPHYLLRVDEPLVIPAKKKIRFVFTAADVLHSWWVPDLGWKKDAIPGFINEAWTSVDQPGIYRGQCTELCGKDHAFMPVVVVALEPGDYDDWAKNKAEEIKNHASLDDEPQEQLVKNGAGIYAKNCSTCHMDDGAGIPGAFPALKGSAVVNGDVIAQANIILNGKNAMPAFGKQLQPAELAEVITFTRNALGNSKGDAIQPKQIDALLKGETVTVAESTTTKEPVKSVTAEKPKAAEAKKPQEKAETSPAKVADAPKSAKVPVDDDVDNVQFAQDKFFPQKRVDDKAVFKNDTKNSQQKKTTAKLSLNDLVKHGEDVYQKNCQSCHKSDGSGMPPLFPALSGSTVVKGKIDDQIQLMLKGKGAMPSFAKTLNAEDFSAVLAFTRNKLGNSVGDFKQPADIEALQSAH